MRRKISFMVLGFCMVTLAAFAARYVVSRQYLADSTNGLWKDLAMTTATANYTSNKMLIKNSEGFNKLIVKTSNADSALAISYQTSEDGGTTWYSPYDTDGTDLGALVTGLASNRAIVFQPAIAEYIRFNYTLSGGNSTVTSELVTKSSL